MEITPRQQECIEKWLKFVPSMQEKCCPFRMGYYNGGNYRDGKICRAILSEVSCRPKIYVKICEAVCPCTVLGVREVKRRARKILKECC